MRKKARKKARKKIIKKRKTKALNKKVNGGGIDLEKVINFKCWNVQNRNFNLR